MSDRCGQSTSTIRKEGRAPLAKPQPCTFIGRHYRRAYALQPVYPFLATHIRSNYGDLAVFLLLP